MPLSSRPALLTLSAILVSVTLTFCKFERNDCAPMPHRRNLNGFFFGSICVVVQNVEMANLVIFCSKRIPLPVAIRFGGVFVQNSGVVRLTP